MKAATLNEHLHTPERPGNALPLVARRAGLLKTGDVRVGDVRGAANPFRHVPQPRAKHDRDAGRKGPQRAGDGLGRCAESTSPFSLLPAHSRIPASVADRKLASVPAIMARKPSRARSCLRSGTRAPMPPIWMPTELIFAKPHSANVAMVNDTGSSCALIGPSCA